MPNRWKSIVAVLLTLAGLGFARAGQALTCIPLPDTVAKMDVIVRGKITAMPAQGVLELAVSRYHKGGDGSAHLQAEVTGLGRGHRMDWDYVPQVGDELIIGFVQRGGALVNDVCNLFVQLKQGQKPPAHLVSLIGEGQPVSQHELAPRKAPLLWWAMAGAPLLLLAAWAVWRRRSRTK